MRLLNTEINSPKIIKKKNFRNSRGFLKETYRKDTVSFKNFY